MQNNLLKNRLEEAVLESRQTAQKIQKISPNWNSFFKVEDKFIVEVGKISIYSAFIKISSFSENPPVFLIKFTQSSLEQEYRFGTQIGNVPEEVRNYGFEILGRAILALKIGKF